MWVAGGGSPACIAAPKGRIFVKQTFRNVRAVHPF